MRHPFGRFVAPGRDAEETTTRRGDAAGRVQGGSRYAQTRGEEGVARKHPQAMGNVLINPYQTERATVPGGPLSGVIVTERPSISIVAVALMPTPADPPCHT